MKQLIPFIYQQRVSLFFGFNLLQPTIVITKRAFELKGIVGAVVILDHGRKFGIFSIAPDHPAPQKSFSIKKNTKLFLDIFF
jgi:hypothetical protein